MPKAAEAIGLRQLLMFIQKSRVDPEQIPNAKLRAYFESKKKEEEEEEVVAKKIKKEPPPTKRKIKSEDCYTFNF